MYHKKIILFFCLNILTICLWAQDMTAVRENIKTLTSKKYKGRGPSYNGFFIS
jgi:hypothetical protein